MAHQTTNLVQIQYQGSSQGSYGCQNNQPSYTRADEDPFANSKGPIDVSSDDLPF